MANYAKIDAFELPELEEYDTERIIIGDRSTSARAKDHLDAVAVKRQWPLRTIPVPEDDANALADYLDSILFGEIAFWLDEFGAESVTVAAMVIDFRVRRARTPWDHRFLRITVREVN